MIVLFAVLKVSVLVTNDFFLLGFRATVALWVSEVLCFALLCFVMVSIVALLCFALLCFALLCFVMVSIVAFQAVDRGSIPR